MCSWPTNWPADMLPTQIESRWSAPAWPSASVAASTKRSLRLLRHSSPKRVIPAPTIATSRMVISYSLTMIFSLSFAYSP